MCSSTIPAANTLLVFAGLESLLPFDHWHLPTVLGAVWTRRVAPVCQVHMSFAMCCFFLACTLLSSACCLQERIAPWYSGMEPAMEGCFERKACFAMIFSSPMELAYPGLALRRAPRLLMSDCELTRAVARKAFFSRVRTPCGHGAQVIVEGREEQTDGGERNEGPKTNPKPKTQARRPKLHHLVVFPLH